MQGSEPQYISLGSFFNLWPFGCWLRFAKERGRQGAGCFLWSGDDQLKALALAFHPCRWRDLPRCGRRCSSCHRSCGCCWSCRCWSCRSCRERRVSTRRTLGSAGRWMCRRWCLRFEEWTWFPFFRQFQVHKDSLILALDSLSTSVIEYYIHIYPRSALWIGVPLHCWDLTC